MTRLSLVFYFPLYSSFLFLTFLLLLHSSTLFSSIGKCHTVVSSKFHPCLFSEVQFVVVFHSECSIDLQSEYSTGLGGKKNLTGSYTCVEEYYCSGKSLCSSKHFLCLPYINLRIGSTTRLLSKQPTKQHTTDQFPLSCPSILFQCHPSNRTLHSI